MLYLSLSKCTEGISTERSSQLEEPPPPQVAQIFISLTIPSTLPLRSASVPIATPLSSTEYPGGENEFSGTIDVIIVPGLAFDHEGGRLGYGGGYYDHFLSANPDALKVGVAYDFQLIDYVPTQCHDVRIDKVIVG